ncbi:TIGR02680 family protein [Nonomuraea sp. NPDC059007]|uniref:TIGR02680 family protein n=1 Tax=Nonomuraea sp. NPDC059007 TaxID=3346692 RepID=UPI003697838B
MLPTPGAERWKPLRAGLVDMFYYDVEEFHFHDGRLLLRGNNGTGKSKVLALTLPFLLDGELTSHRVEPDGDRQKRMEWNLLLGGKHPHPERLGYTWLEFGRRAADGGQEFRTIGCGLKAVRDRGVVRHWFFVTPQRVGAGLSLISPTGVALTRENLREAVDGHGMVYDRAADYRRAVDEALFWLGEHRYEALVNLLIQLRQPQLSKRPDEKLLSRALTEALPPLSSTLLATVADAFRGLDEERDALRGLDEARKAAAGFLDHYRAYAATATKRKAAGPRLTQSRYEQLGRDLAEAELRQSKAEAELESVDDLLSELATEKNLLDARRTALQQSPEMRDAERLDQTREEAGRLAEHAQRTGKELSRADGETGRLARRAETAREKAARAQEEHDTIHHAAADAAGRAGVELSESRREAENAVVRQEHAIAQLERLLRAVADAAAGVTTARAEVDRLTGELTEAAEAIALAGQVAGDRAAELLDSFTGYLTGLSELWVADRDGVLAVLRDWAENAAGPNPAAAAVDDALRQATAALARRETELDAELAAARLAADELAVEIARLEAGGHDAPPAPHTRAPRGDTRPGAPLWKVVDFADGVPADHRAGLEAALEASGLLDAWLTPQAELILGDTVILRGRVTGPSCANVLRPAIDRADPQAAALDDAIVLSVLAGIGLGPGSPTWIATDGRWVNGLLAGAWHKSGADHNGEGARESARRARLAALARELADATLRADDLDRDKQDLAVRQAVLAAEHRALPSDAPVREAHVKLAGAHEHRRTIHERHQRAVGVMNTRQAELDAAQVRAAEFAGDVGLPAEHGPLGEIRASLAEYRLELARLWPAVHALNSAREDEREAAQEVALAAERLAEAAQLAAEAGERARAAAEVYRSLAETAGAAVEELFRRLEEVRQELRGRDRAENDARARQQRLATERGKAEGVRERLAGEIVEATRARDEAVRDFRAFAATGLLKVALPGRDMPDPATAWSATPTVVLARAVNADLEAVDDGDGPWERVQRKVADEHKLLSDAMARQGHSAGLTVTEGVMIVDVTFQGRARDIPDLVAALAEETAGRARLLSAKERELLENHLLNEVAGTLHELIAAAETEVGSMNEELQSRPTSTGMRLRLVWKTAKNAPEGLDRVRGKLRQTVDAWSQDDRTAVGSFLQERIAREHADNPAAGWIEALTRALDYRVWHEFAIQRLQEGQWRPATGPASGGERVLAASVPLFAAASAHYKSAGNPHAPRLVALDEAFAGVDDDSRAKCLGLLATFDMDVVMTSEREWGCYPQVPGLAIAQLSRHDGIDAVLVTPWRWDGRERRRVERPSPGGGLADE